MTSSRRHSKVVSRALYLLPLVRKEPYLYTRIDCRPDLLSCRKIMFEDHCLHGYQLIMPSSLDHVLWLVLDVNKHKVSMFICTFYTVIEPELFLT